MPIITPKIYYLELNLVAIKNKQTHKIQYFAVNDKHYDGMLAGSGSSIDLEYEWNWLGSVFISDEILTEEQKVIQALINKED